MWLIGAQYGHTRAVYPAAAAVMNGHGSFSGVGAFSVVGHNGVHSSMKIIKKLGLLVFSVVAHGCAQSSRKIIKTLVADCECRLMGCRVKGG